MPKLLCPDLSALLPGKRFLYRAKIGGERQLINVCVASHPYLGDYGKDRKSWYVDVFGYGWKGTVQVRKLLSASLAPIS